MSDFVILYGSFGLRINEPGSVVQIQPAPVQHNNVAGLCCDLRQIGLTHLASDLVPLALARVIEPDRYEITALAMRIDEHRIHFWTPVNLLTSVDRPNLALVLRHLFQTHHLELNNFECNLHLIDPAVQQVRAWVQTQGRGVSWAGLLPEVMDAIESGQWGLMLQPGNEYTRLAQDVTCLRRLDNDGLLTLARGGRCKKPAWDAPLWSMEQFRPLQDGGWARVASEHLANDLCHFDTAPGVVAAQFCDAPLQVLGEMTLITHRLALESLHTSALLELVLCQINGSTGMSTLAVLRGYAARHPDTDTAADCTRVAKGLAHAFPERFGSQALHHEVFPRFASDQFTGKQLSGVL
ncbi:MAG: hypothetical protein GQ535_03535 [Rhodobacteraceae bacterium]|nr:hypothetical protein [Paracoccaceae bacterium]